MLPFFNKRPAEVSIVSAGELVPDEQESASNYDLITVMMKMMIAITDKDPKGMAEAFEDAMTICNNYNDDGGL